ncbi:interleukin-1 receptor-associated kinase 1-binding protein 1 homolog [Alosa sapidissima]|uniref:interleukin-1 receptor-associated kinase 1-binding protein 1 homolog n=1 Tax=Alosa sapidissima TaxID=34773 RepID=UPI001C09427E|nr:interleukin-1 receptor-associated kinase 1-binding protein 1 homolog [Alosa sapidissima]
MASSPSRVFAALLPVASEFYNDENLTGFGRVAKETTAVAQIPPREVQVTGSAELSCPPDRATVSISVSSSKESVNDVKNSVSRRVEYIIQTVRQHDVKEADTAVTKYIQKVDDLYIMEVEVLVVFLDFDKMQKVRSVLLEKLDKSVCVGLPHFTHSPECLSALRRRVCVAAVESARLKASEVCCTLGQGLGRPLLVREEESREWRCGDTPLTLQQRAGLIALSVSSRVFVSFELRPKDRPRKKP